jgi:hypothetical protein
VRPNWRSAFRSSGSVRPDTGPDKEAGRSIRTRYLAFGRRHILVRDAGPSTRAPASTMAQFEPGITTGLAMH